VKIQGNNFDSKESLLISDWLPRLAQSQVTATLLLHGRTGEPTGGETRKKHHPTEVADRSTADLLSADN
jgi:hypothetical protein